MYVGANRRNKQMGKYFIAAGYSGSLVKVRTFDKGIQKFVSCCPFCDTSLLHTVMNSVFSIHVEVS